MSNYDEKPELIRIRKREGKILKDYLLFGYNRDEIQMMYGNIEIIKFDKLVFCDKERNYDNFVDNLTCGEENVYIIKITKKK